jgi:hypothetical protein
MFGIIHVPQLSQRARTHTHTHHPQTLPQMSRVHCTLQTVQKFKEEPHSIVIS